MTEGEVMEVLVKRCQNLGTIKRMNTAVMSQISKHLAAIPDMTAEKVMNACKNPAEMLRYFPR